MTDILGRFISPEGLALAEHFLHLYGGWGVLGLGFVVGVWQPIAPDYFIVATSLLGRSPYPMAATAVLGTAIGAGIGYMLGRVIGTAVLARAFRTRQRNLDRIEKLFGKYGVIAVTICAATPVPMKYSLWMSGALHLSVPRYLIALLAGYIPRVFLIAYLSRWVAAI